MINWIVSYMSALNSNIDKRSEIGLTDSCRSILPSGVGKMGSESETRRFPGRLFRLELPVAGLLGFLHEEDKFGAFLSRPGHGKPRQEARRIHC